MTCILRPLSFFVLAMTAALLLSSIPGWSAESGNAAALFTSMPYLPAEERIDAFGIRTLYPEAEQGRIWFSEWSNGIVRRLPSGSADPFDADFVSRGEGMVRIDGAGVAVVSGEYPRLYVYDPVYKKKWNNVEVTVYAKRGAETRLEGSQGIIIGARSEHQYVTEGDPCPGFTYYGKFLYDGRAVFQKELIHETHYSSNQPDEENAPAWPTEDNSIPQGTWVGMKFIVRTDPEDGSVVLELYRDMTDGLYGGFWEKVAAYTDTGSWYALGVNGEARCPKNPPNVLSAPATSVFIRNDFIEHAEYKKFSIREIDGTAPGHYATNE